MEAKYGHEQAHSQEAHEADDQVLDNIEERVKALQSLLQDSQAAKAQMVRPREEAAEARPPGRKAPPAAPREPAPRAGGLAGRPAARP